MSPVRRPLPRSPQRRLLRIDAWSPADGSVFASWRGPRTDIWQEDDANAAPACITLHAPLFQVRPVPRAMAFGAVHRGYQEGFSLTGEDEVGFENVEQLRELVRRTYLAYGIGDGGPAEPGGGPTKPPPPEPEGQDRPFRAKARKAEADLQHTLRHLPVAGDRSALARSLEEAIDPWVRRKAGELLARSAAMALKGDPRAEASDTAWALYADLAAQEIGTQALSRVLNQAFGQYDAPEEPYRLTRWQGLRGSGRCGSVAAVLAGALPGSVELPALPPLARNWGDAMAWFTADRGACLDARADAWLPLALALSSIALNAHAPPVTPWCDRAEIPVRLDEQWTRRRAAWIADLPPDRTLSPALDDLIHATCWRAAGPAAG